MINPRNHCYLNSTLQIIFRIKDILFSGQNVNTNIEGRLVSFLLDSLRSGSETQMANFKNELAHFKSFYDGQIQRDVYECFQGILSIMHVGTRYSILGPDGDLDDEDFVTSVTKSMFSYVLKRTLTCLKCSKISEFFIPSSDLHIYPSNLKSIQYLVRDSLHGSLLKGCNCSDGNSNHLEISEFEALPKILCIVVNRYNFNSRANKNSCFITIENKLELDGQIFDHAATIYHHGEQTSSGHYTAKITYRDVAFMCDDHSISSVDLLEREKSKSCYLIIYVRRDQPG